MRSPRSRTPRPRRTPRRIRRRATRRARPATRRRAAVAPRLSSLIKSTALLLALAPVLGFGCRTGGAQRGGQSATSIAPAPVDPTLAMAPPQALAALAIRYWDERLQAHPLEATDIGDRRFDDRLPDP